jgi:hypothetical protein
MPFTISVLIPFPARPLQQQLFLSATFFTFFFLFFFCLFLIELREEHMHCAGDYPAAHGADRCRGAGGDSGLAGGADAEVAAREQHDGCLSPRARPARPGGRRHLHHPVRVHEARAGVVSGARVLPLGLAPLRRGRRLLQLRVERRSGGLVRERLRLPRRRLGSQPRDPLLHLDATPRGLRGLSFLLPYPPRRRRLGRAEQRAVLPLPRVDQSAPQPLRLQARSSALASDADSGKEEEINRIEPRCLRVPGSTGPSRSCADRAARRARRRGGTTPRLRTWTTRAPNLRLCRAGGSSPAACAAAPLLQTWGPALAAAARRTAEIRKPPRAAASSRRRNLRAHSNRPHQSVHPISPPESKNATKSFHRQEPRRRQFDSITSMGEVQEEGRMLLVVRRHRVLRSLRHLHRRRSAHRCAAASADNPNAQISHPIGPGRRTIASEETTRATAGTGTWRGTGARGGADGGGNAPALPLLDQPDRWMRTRRACGRRRGWRGRVGGRRGSRATRTNWSTVPWSLIIRRASWGAWPPALHLSSLTCFTHAAVRSCCR